MYNEKIELEQWTDIGYDIKENILYIFTDWSSRWVFSEVFKRKTWRHWWMGIWFVYIWNDFKIYWENHSDGLSYDKATNQEMELKAMVEWLTIAHDEWYDTKYDSIVVVTDSEFICKNRRNSLFKRPFNGWKTVQRNNVIHKDLRKKFNKIFPLIKKNTSFNTDWVKWHSWIMFNEKADESAGKSARSKNRVAFWWWKSERFFFLEKVDFDKDLPIYWVKNILIHVSNSVYTHGQYRFICEVVSPESKYFWYRTYIYTGDVMSAGVIYEVDIKNDNSYQIERIIAEYEKDEIREKILKYWKSEDVFYKSKNGKKKN